MIRFEMRSFGVLVTVANTANYLRNSMSVALRSTIFCRGREVARRRWRMWRWHARIATPPNLDAAVEAALTTNHRDFLRFLAQRLGNTDTAQDVWQQFYLRALSRAADLRRRKSVVSWLDRLLNSTFADSTRRDTTRRRQEAAAVREHDRSRADPELETTVYLCLYKLLPTLKPEYAEVLWRVDLLEVLRQEVAHALGSR